MMNRREVLLGAAALAAAAQLPTAAVAKQPLPAWAVGTPGEFNWQRIIAKTAEEAEGIFRNENCEFECEEDAPCGECDGCTMEVIAERKPVWDGIVNPTPADWLRAGSGTFCSRCSYETFPEENGHPVVDEAVCEDCMTLADWDIVDPARAAELRAVLLETQKMTKSRWVETRQQQPDVE
jgi:hypothetical protein